MFASYERKKCALSTGNKSLGGLSKNSVAKITDHPDMTIAVNRGVKAHKAVRAKFPFKRFRIETNLINVENKCFFPFTAMLLT